MWGMGTSPFRLNPGQCQQKPELSAAITRSKGRRGPEPVPRLAGLLQTLYFSVERLLGERSAALGEVRENEWWCPGTSGPFFPARTRAPLPADSHCLWEGRSLALVGSGGVWRDEHSLQIAPCLGFALRGTSRDSSFGHLPPLRVLGWPCWPVQEDRCQCLLSSLQRSWSFPRL